MKTRSRGFTLVEMMVTVAIIGIVAAVAIPVIRGASQNASVGAAAFDLQLRLQGLKTRALADQDTLLAVLVDAPGNSGSNCVLGRSNECATLFVLRNPTTAWTLGAFDPANPAVNAQFVDSKTLGKGIRFANDPVADKTRILHDSPKPFETVKVFSPTFTGACAGRACLAVRFSPAGAVSAEPATAPTTTPRGVAFAIGSDLVKNMAASEARAILVTFPAGIVKSFSL